jgi:osmotically-inducible protein OsmY
MSTTEDIRGAVYRALKADPMINAADIEVGVAQQRVTLNGTVPSQEQVSEASHAAGGVDGVTRVYNLLGVALPSEDYGDDAALAAIANQALGANSAVPAGVRATSRDGNITLTGSVSTTDQRDAAEDTIAGVGGVVSIRNEVVVLAGTPDL